jgi:hypothetical protein
MLEIYNRQIETSKHSSTFQNLSRIQLVGFVSRFGVMRLHPELGIIPYTYEHTGRVSVMGLTQFEAWCAGVCACLEVRSDIYGIRSFLTLTADDNLASRRPARVGMALKLASEPSVGAFSMCGATMNFDQSVCPRQPICLYAWEK